MFCHIKIQNMLDLTINGLGSPYGELTEKKEKDIVGFFPEEIVLRIFSYLNGKELT